MLKVIDELIELENPSLPEEHVDLSTLQQEFELVQPTGSFNIFEVLDY